MATTEQLGTSASTNAGSLPETGLKRRGILLMLVLTVVTFGFYYPPWFLRRRRGLNSLNSPRKLAAWPFALFLGMFVIQFSVGLISGSRPAEEAIGATALSLVRVIRLAVGILMVVQCFYIKDILEDHLAGPEDSAPSALFSSELKLSGLMTFFFTIFYLQHVINRDILTRRSTSPDQYAGSLRA